MPACDLIYTGMERLVTLDHGGDGPLIAKALGEYEPILDAAIAVTAGKIVACGPREELLKHWQGKRRQELGASLVTPGFVDCHTHPVWVKSRAEEFEMRLAGESYEAILAAGGGIHNSVAALQAASDDELLKHTLRHLRQLARHGVVAAECKSGYGLSLDDELRSLRAIRTAQAHTPMRLTATCLAAHVVPKASAGRKAEYLDLVCDQILPRVAAEKLADAADIFVEQGAFDGDDARRLMTRSHELGLSVHVHADQLNPGDGARLAAELRARSADHLEYTTPETMDAMAEAGTFAVMLPGSTFALKQDRWAPAREFVDRGVPVALATDFNPGSSPIPNPAFTTTLACLHMGLSPKEALAAATRNAAHCLGLGAEYGSLAPGRAAAFICWDLDDVREIPYYAGSNMIDRVVAGASCPPA